MLYNWFSVFMLLIPYFATKYDGIIVFQTNEESYTSEIEIQLTCGLLLSSSISHLDFDANLTECLPR